MEESGNVASVGIDYGLGTTNIDTKTGIRFGVISADVIGQAWYDDSKPKYGYVCDCGYKLNEDMHCEKCNKTYDEELFEFCDPSFSFEDEEYSAQQDQDSQYIFITKSPFYTKCKFCSPCAPGAGYLTDHIGNGIKAYCFGTEWFKDDEAPYPVYSVKTDELLYTPKSHK